MIARLGRKDRRDGMPRATAASRAGALWIGAVMAVALLWSDAARAVEPHVVMLRGWFGVFSTGLDGLADELKSKGIHAEVDGHLYWSTAVAEILKERAAGKVRPIVLIGH